MSRGKRSPEQRQHTRYQLTKKIFAAIQGYSFDAPVIVADLSCNGIGFSFPCSEKKLKGRQVAFDLVSDNNYAILRSLAAQVVFTRETARPKKDEDKPSRRYGLKFVNLTALQKKQLRLIAKKYGRPEQGKNLPCRGVELSPMRPWEWLEK